MKSISATLGLLLSLAVSLPVARAVENTWDYSVQVSSSVQSSPAKITLTWPQDTNGTPSSYTISRKSPRDTSWGAGTTIAGSSTSYVDTSVTAGTAYEYRIVKAAGGYTGYGYIQTGVEAALIDNRGKVVLVVDSSIAGSLTSELTRLENDLAGDGWVVVRRNVARTDSASTVKSVIKAVYDADPANVKSVFLFGHVPVPYSGQLNPDGHPDHNGAWPADAFYGDMDGSWTDSSVNYTQSINTDPVDAARLSNRPGDGKFDQTQLPSAIELEVGRVDLANLPGRTTWGGPATLPNEIELLRNYLNKDNNFRHRRTNPQRKAVVGDYFGSRGGEAFAASGFRSFAPLVGASNIRNLNIEFNDQRGVWMTQVASQEYLLAYGCGAGSYATVAGLGSTGQYNDGSTPELVSKNSGGVFNLMFGSWLGDWDHEDNILRAPLATTRGLVSVWSGRPHWFIHSVGLGETIGYSARLTQNNNGLYQTAINSSQNRIHVALMGDPTLRLHPVVPVSSLNGSVTGSSAALSWGASNDSGIVGYHVYRRTSATSDFTRLTSSPITATNYVDNASTSGATYMVRAIKLENTSSGSYYNPSQGIFWTVGGSSTPTTPTTPPADTTAPTIAMTQPAAALTISAGASITLQANATDNVGVASVQFKVNTTNIGSAITSAPFTTSLDTSSLPAGMHTVSAVARDSAGNQSASLPVPLTVLAVSTPTTPPTTTTPTTPTSPTAPAGTTVWFDDAIPAGAGASASGGDGWNWVSASPAPFSGSKAHQSNIVAGLHEHAFNWGSPMTVNAGDILVTYVYLDPSNLPSQIMLSFAADNWEHRAYWGANQISNGTNGTASRFRVGDLPAAGQWVRLEVPASAIALEGKSVQGMSFSTYNGRATFDLTGKATATTTTPTTPSTTTPTTPTDTSTGTTVTVAATDANAVIGSATDTATLTFTRTGSTAASLVVNYTVTGSAVKWIDYRRVQGDMPTNVTIPAGATSTTMTILAIANVTSANPPTAIFALASDSAYTVGSANKATLTFGLTAVTTPTTPTTTEPTTPTTTTPPTTTAPTTSADTVWFDDALPAGASGGGTNGDGWNWVTSSPAPFSGTKAHQTNLAAGLHEHYFNWASNALTPAAGDKLFFYVYLDAANAPAQIMLSFSADNWEHRAYWGGNYITNGTNGTASRYRVGDLPAAGQWVRLEVSAAALGLEGQSIKGMSFSLYGGRATFDQLGKTSASSITSSSSTTTTSPTGPTASTPTTGTDFVWVDDSVPAGAGTGVSGGDAWNWVTTGAFSGSKAHQTAAGSGLREHYFNWASNKMTVGTGDVLYTYVYLDPANLPSTIMLSFGADNWEHRVYWGSNTITYGANGTAGRHYAGPLPAAGQWVRLEVPASALALEGQSVQAMCFSTFNGRVTFDKTGKVSR